MPKQDIPLTYEKQEFELSADAAYQALSNKLEQLKAEAILKKKRSSKEIEVVSFLLEEMLLYRSIKEHGSFTREILNPENRKFLIGRFIEENKSKSKEQLLDDFSNLQLDYYGLTSLNDHNLESYRRVFGYFFEASVKQSKGDKKRVNARNELNSKDNQRLMECLTELKSDLERPLIGSDLAKFISLVKRKYPKQLFIQAPRLTKEEKSLSKEDRDYVLASKKEKRGDSWSRPRLVKFFESETGLRGTTKKSSSHK